MSRRWSALLGAIAAFGLAAVPAGAAEVTVNCAGLPSALSGAKAGDKITLNELCKGPFPYKLPAVQMTLAGTPGAGFDGGSTVQLEGSGGAPTIEGLIFENAHSTAINSGGALSLNGAPEGSTVTLARDTFAGDVASGGEGGGARLNTISAAVTVTDSTFSANSAAVGSGALAIYATSAQLSGDTFTGNSVTGAEASGGALFAFTLGGPVTLASSQFSDNSAHDEGGGALLAAEAEGVGFSLSGNTFSHNSVSDPAGTNKDPRGYLGGGLSLQGETATPVRAVQQGNTFDSNSVSFKAAAVSAMGGGESTTHVELQSTGDHFTNNTLQSPNAAEHESKKVFGWGAGLSVAQCGDTTEAPPTVPNVTSTLTNAIVAGNTLLGGPSANGAGIYVGFVCPSAYATLQLNDSTVAGNRLTGASGRVAGISGGPHDVLAMTNTIVFGDVGGPEFGGFQSLAGVSAAFSDVCVGGAATFEGPGNICINPLLVEPAAGSADVRETAVSPTLGRGSDALIPAGVGSDAFGGPRVLGPIFCGASPAPIVDIGAAEYAYAVPSCPPSIVSSHSQSPLASPTLSSLGQTNKTWREGNALARLSSTHAKGKKKPPIGTTFSFKLDRAAQVAFTFTKPAPGRKVGKRCVAQTPKNKRKRRCKRTVSAGALTLAAHAGTNKVRFQGLISRRKKLKPGSYKLLVTATAAGKRSRTGTLSFTIVR